MAISTPPSMAASTPMLRLPVEVAAIKPITAPISIMPSWPRLRTPERSHTSSPRATSSNGVPATTVAASTLVISTLSISGLSCHGLGGPTNANAVVNKGVTGQQVEQQQPLEQSGDRLGQGHGTLQHLAAHEGQRQQRGCQHDADRLHAPEEYHDNCGVAVAG